MLTLYYVAATWLQSWRLSSTLSKIREIRSKKGSIVLHQEVAPYVYTVPSPTSNGESKMLVNGVLSKSCSNHNISNIKDLIWFNANKKILSIYPQQELDISNWISVIPGKTQLPVEIDSSSIGQTSLSATARLLILLEADCHSKQISFPFVPLKLERYGVALAWHVDEHLSVLVETDENKLASLCLLFMHNHIVLDGGLNIIRIISVKAHGTPYKIKNSDTVPQTYAPLNPDLCGIEREEALMSRWRARISMMSKFSEAVQQVYTTLDETSVIHPGSGVGAVWLVPGDVNETLIRDESGIIEEDPEQMMDSDVTDGNNDVVSNTQHPPTDTTAICYQSSTTISSLKEDTISTDTVIPPDSTRHSGEMSVDTCASSLRSFPTTPLRTTVSTSVVSSSFSAKPPNILVFSESCTAADAVRSALHATLHTNKYTVDEVSWSRLIDSKTDCRLLVIHGDVPSPGPLIRRLVSCPGSAAFVLCSDLLRSVLPMFRTAEVRPNELVRCSYKSWKHVPLVHHIFMYQPSPPANAFSHDHHSNVLPEWSEMMDELGNSYRLKIQVLGTEETWKTPSLLQVTLTQSNSTIIFSQVHLELEPGGEDIGTDRLEALKQSDKARLEILCDVLSNHLGLQATLKRPSVTFTPAYFLGNHERKQMLVNELLDRGYLNQSFNIECGSGLTMRLCGKETSPPQASSTLLPVLLHACPHSFSTVQYFEELKSEFMGRLVIFSEVLGSSMDIVRGPPLHHGLAVIPLRQTKGSGRGGNSWLSPDGCGMFTLQLHIPLSSYLGSHLSLVQHLAGLAVVSAVCSIPGLQDLDIGLKWPNDIYANKSIKIGGIIVTSSVNQNVAVCNIGCGVNVYNKEPTTCLNDLIEAHSKATNCQIESLTLERYFALVFNRFEELYDQIQSNHIDPVNRLYYDFWLHSDALVTVREVTGEEKEVTLRGIDEYGFLLAETLHGDTVILQPDGNSFDMMQGLIVSKST